MELTDKEYPANSRGVGTLASVLWSNSKDREISFIDRIIWEPENEIHCNEI